MQTNIKPCPHCHGTGEIRTAWYAIVRYQDGSDSYGPFDTLEDAKREYPDEDGYGCTMEYEERVV